MAIQVGGLTKVFETGRRRARRRIEAVRDITFEVEPAVFVSAVPARLVAEPTAAGAAALVGVTVAFAVAAWLAFTTGLTRDTSGSVWTRA